MSNEIIKLDTIDEYNKHFGLKALHPLANVDCVQFDDFVAHGA